MPVTTSRSGGGLNYAQIEGVWLKAAHGTKYATRKWAALMAAIALAESGGSPWAMNPHDDNGRQTSWGLWQISNGTHSQPSANWNNPYVNAKLAVDKLQSQGLGAWGTYNTGAYKAFLSDRTTPDTSGLPGGAAEGTEPLSAAGLSAGSNCLWHVGTPALPIGSLSFLTLRESVGLPSIGFCVLTKSEARAVLGAVMLSAGLGVLLFGVLLTARVTGVQEIADMRPGGGKQEAPAPAAAAAAAPAAAPEAAPEVVVVEQAAQNKQQRTQDRQRRRISAQQQRKRAATPAPAPA